MPSRRCSGEFDQEEPAERPEGLSAKALLTLLIDDDDALAGVGDLGRRDQSRQAAADHDYVRVFRHRCLPAPILIQARVLARGQLQTGS